MTSISTECICSRCGCEQNLNLDWKWNGKLRKYCRSYKGKNIGIEECTCILVIDLKEFSEHINILPSRE